MQGPQPGKLRFLHFPGKLLTIGALEGIMYAEYPGHPESKSKDAQRLLKRKENIAMIYSAEVQHMCSVGKGAYHGPAPIPEEGKWVQAKQISDISGFTHGIGWCAPQQAAAS